MLPMVIRRLCGSSDTDTPRTPQKLYEAAEYLERREETMPIAAAERALVVVSSKPRSSRAVGGRQAGTLALRRVDF